MLRTDETTAAIQRIASLLSIDLGRFDRLLAQVDGAAAVKERHESRLELQVLHAIRQALILKAVPLAGSLPRISERHDTSQRDVIRMVCDLRLAEAAGVLARIFPLSGAQDEKLEELTETGSGRTSGHGYDRLHREVIGPLDEIDRNLHSISLALTHAYGAFG